MNILFMPVSVFSSRSGDQNIQLRRRGGGPFEQCLSANKMSSEEVAELAQAIHNHADVLYESWKKGQEAFNMKRMEDTLELLADPGLTPKLEHLVSTFVRRDKAKRQQFHHQLSPPPADSDGNRRETSPIGSGSPRKPLPKSILAVVQRFEPPKTDPNNSEMVISQRERSPAAAENLVRYNVPGVGPITKNVLWAESINKHSASEKVLDRSVSPVPCSSPVIPVNTNATNTKSFIETSSQPIISHHHHLKNGNNNVINHVPSVISTTKTVISPTTGKLVRERHIPIERVDEDPLPTKTKPVARYSPVKTSTPIYIQLSVPDGPAPSSPNPSPSFKKSSEIQELEREEEKLFRALRTGQVLAPKYQVSPTNNNNSIPPREKVSPHEGSNGTNGVSTTNSRIAFAKERIRQSQEHPLTQQRLEMQKRLPYPSAGSGAAAIAVQQGKLKFQPVNGNNIHISLEDDVSSSPVNNNRENGRNSFVKFGPGATVADRVQLFEKYPTHISPPPIIHSRSPSPNNNLSSNHNHNNHINHHHHNHHPNLPIQINIPPSSHHEGSPWPGKSPQQNQNQPTTLNATAPWRTSPGRDSNSSTTIHIIQQQNHQPTVESSLSGSIRKQPISSSLKRSSLDKSSRLANTDVPRFYWPEGKPDPNSFVQASILKAEDKLKTSANSVNYNKFGELLQAVGIPLYWKKPFWMALSLPTDGQCSSKIFIPFLRYLLCECPDDASRFIRIVSSASKNFSESLNGTLNNNNRNSKYYMNHGDFCQDMKQVELSMSDFIPMVQDIIDTHPGLGFLRDAPEFHSRYVTTVISRIFYKVNRSWSCRISLTELRRSNILRVIKRLEEETDINSITEYFSYEHFYVIYCKFWELDKDHDLLIDKHDLSLHADHALSSRIIDRIFSGTVLRGWDVNSPVKAASNKMTYSDFVWFLLSEEDKKTPTAIEYWFRCLDLDGDGIISPYELQYFYSEQESRIESLGIEPLHFSNVYCQIVDMLHCSPTGIRLRDLKRNAYLAANVFNTVFNLDKYLEHEQRDPFAAASSLGNVENTEGESDWDKYASAEYELLIAEETPSEHLHDSGLEEVLTP